MHTPPVQEPPSANTRICLYKKRSRELKRSSTNSARKNWKYYNAVNTRHDTACLFYSNRLDGSINNSGVATSLVLHHYKIRHRNTNRPSNGHR
jgi:hypothetical protein